MKKFKKILTVAATGMIALSLVGCSDNSKSGSSKPKSSQKVKKTNTQKTSFRKSYDKIKVGDVMQQGTGGSTIKDVKAILGQPESVSSTAVKGFKVKSYSYLTLLFWCNSVIKRLSLRQFRVLNGLAAAISYRLKHLIV